MATTAKATAGDNGTAMVMLVDEKGADHGRVTIAMGDAGWFVVAVENGAGISGNGGTVGAGQVSMRRATFRANPSYR